MAQQLAQQPGPAAAAATNSPRIRGILKTPRSCLKTQSSQAGCMTCSAAGDPASSSTTAAGLSQAPSIDAFFLQLDSNDDSKQNKLKQATSNEDISNSRKQKHALIIDPACTPEDSSKTPTCQAASGPSCTLGITTQSVNAKQHIRLQLPGDALPSLTSTPRSPKSPKQQQQQHRTSLNTGQVSPRRRISTLPVADATCSSPTTAADSSSRYRSSSILAPSSPRSCCGFINNESPPSSPSSSSRFSQLCVTPRARSCPNGSILSSNREWAASSSSSGGADSSSGKQYGAAWYLKSKEWNYINRNLQQGSTWHRESQHITELDEQQRFIQQLQQSANPSNSSDRGSNHQGNSNSNSGPNCSSSGVPTPAALEAVIQGLGSPENNASLAGLSHEVLATNTWVLSKKDVLDHEAADAAAIQAAQQYYRQLQATAKQQAALNDKVKGSYALRAYKEFMRSKGYRQAACFQRLPTPTDEDMRLAKVKVHQYWKTIQQRLRIHHKAQRQQPEKVQLQQLVQHWQAQPQQQPQHGEGAAAVRGSAATGRSVAVGEDAHKLAAAAGAVAAFRAAASASRTSTGGRSSLAAAMDNTQAAATAANPTEAAAGSSSGAADAPVAVEAASPPTTAAVPVVPRLDLDEVTRVTRRLHELKSSCHPESGLDGTDFELLEALLTGGRQALPKTEPAAASSSGRLGSSSGRLGSSSGWLSSRECIECDRVSNSTGGMRTGASTSRVGSSSGNSSSRRASSSSSRQPWTCFFTTSGCGSSNSNSRLQLQSRSGGLSQQDEQQQQPVASPRRRSSCSSGCQGAVDLSPHFSSGPQQASHCFVTADTGCSRRSSLQSSSGTSPMRGSSGLATAVKDASHGQQHHQQQARLSTHKLCRLQHLSSAGQSHPQARSSPAAAAPLSSSCTQDAARLSITGSRVSNCSNSPPHSCPGFADRSTCRTSVSAGSDAMQPRPQQQSPRLTSRGSPMRLLTPYAGSLLENVPVCISYTLTKGRCAASPGRAPSPGKASSTAGATKGHAASGHLRLPPCSR